MSRLNDILTPDILRKLAKVNILKFTVRGISMCPLIQPDDIVEIAASEKYEPPDILLYPYKEEGLLLHRLIKVDERLFCKGDNALEKKSASLRLMNKRLPFPFKSAKIFVKENMIKI